MLAGLIERITYHNSENRFCVLRVGHPDVGTVVGHAQPSRPASGSPPQANGSTTAPTVSSSEHDTYAHPHIPPTSADGIEKYLSSGMIRGVGPVYAKKLVRAFGEKVFDVIESKPEPLREVDRHRSASRRQHSRRVGRAEGGAGDQCSCIAMGRHGTRGTTYGADAIQVMRENCKKPIDIRIFAYHLAG